MKKDFKQLSIFLLMLILLSVGVSAYNFSAEVVPLKNDIYSNETARFLLLINNTSPKNIVFSIYGPEVEWSVSTDPTIDANKKIYKQSTGETILTIKPSNAVQTGLQGVPVVIRNTIHNERMTIHPFVNIKSIIDQKSRYLPSIKAEVDIPDEIDPKKEFILKVNIENKNKLNIEKITININSDANLIKEKFETTLGPWGTNESKRTLEFKTKFDDLERPVNDIVRVYVTAISYNKTYNFGPFEADYSIKEYGEVSEKIDLEEKFLQTKKIITLTNNANDKKIKKYSIENSFIKNIYISTKPKANIAELDGKRSLTWDIELDIGETVQIIINEDFRPLFFTLIIAIIIIISYYYFRNPIVIYKTATITKQKEGGISEICIQMNILNRWWKPIVNLEIKDRLPDLLVLIKEFKIGTIHPTKILKHEKRGTIVKYHIDKLEKNEERIITYNAEAKLSIVGNISLPLAITKFKKEGKDKTFAAKTDAVEIISKE